MRRGYVKKVNGHPVADQCEALAAAGLPDDAIYHDQTPVAALMSLREGDELCIAGSLRILAQNREAMREAVTTAHDAGAVIVDVTRDHRTGPGDGAQMMAEAIAEIAQDKRRGIDPRAAARARWGDIKRLPVKEAHELWFSRAHRTAADALEHMPGWSRIAAYRQFGPRNFR